MNFLQRESGPGALTCSGQRIGEAGFARNRPVLAAVRALAHRLTSRIADFSTCFRKQGLVTGVEKVATLVSGSSDRGRACPAHSGCSVCVWSRDSGAAPLAAPSAITTPIYALTLPPGQGKPRPYAGPMPMGNGSKAANVTPYLGNRVLSTGFHKYGPGF